MLRRIVLAFGSFSALLTAQSVQITSPADGTVFQPGQSVTVQVATTGSFQQVVIVPWNPLKMTSPLSAPPYTFTVPIPNNIQPGSYLITAVGVISPGQTVHSHPISITVEPSTNPDRYEVRPSTVTMWVGGVAPLRVTGKYPSGPDLDITFSTQTQYVSENPAIATVDNFGRVTGVAPGLTYVVINNWKRIPITIQSPVQIYTAATPLYGGQSRTISAKVRLQAGESATWSISPNLGTISSAGPSTATYTAPATIANHQSVTVTAAATADPTKTASIVLPLYPPISVTVAPTTATLRAAQQLQFTWTVNNSDNGAVVWTIIPAGVGTITSGLTNGTPNGLYTAPQPIPANQTITVKATSNRDPTKSATATVSLKNHNE
jgi:hypothetical protein